MFRFVWCLMLLLTHPLFSQDVKRDMQKIRQAYSSLGKFSANISVSIYENWNAKVVIDYKKASVKKDGDNYLTELENSFMLVNTKYMVMINKQEKSIVFSEGKPVAGMVANNYADPIPDSALSKTDSIRYVGLVDGLKKYVLNNAASQIVKTEFFVDPVSFLIKKTIYYYDKELYPVGGKVEVVYQDMNTAPVFSASEFSEEKYLSDTGKNPKPSKKYAGYVVINAESLRN